MLHTISRDIDDVSILFIGTVRSRVKDTTYNLQGKQNAADNFLRSFEKIPDPERGNKH